MKKRAKCFRMRIWMGVKEKQTETERRRKNDAQICIRRLDCSVLASLHTESEAYWLLLLLYNTQRVYFFPTYTRIALSLSPLVSSTLLFFNFFSPSNFNPFVILYMGFSRNSAALSLLWLCVVNTAAAAAPKQMSCCLPASFSCWESKRTPNRTERTLSVYTHRTIAEYII